ncbi:MAG: transposase [Deltaproteobacteria bacterium]|nr:transposase [Deltaproteobacteria bacterium]
MFAAIRHVVPQARDMGKRFVMTGSFNPQGKTCSQRGAAEDAPGLSKRVCVCDSCGQTHDLALNAAVNILADGLRALGMNVAGSRGTRSDSPDSDSACSGSC